MRLVFAGGALNPCITMLANELGISDRVVQFANPGVEVIEALYNRAVALLFLSRYEGFRWRAIEAQVCGCPAVASSIPPLAEVLRQTALLYHFEDESGGIDLAACLGSRIPRRDAATRFGKH